ERVVVVDRAPVRPAVARTLGADLAIEPEQLPELRAFAPLGFDLIAEATGVPAVLESTVEFARPGGTVWVFGVAPEDAYARIAPYQLFRRDLSLVGSFAVNRTMAPAVALIRSGAVRVEPLVSHVLPIDRFAEGMELAEHDPERMKVQFGWE
ncbi:MAG: zinc-binding dehydrogenase, partial [Trueperaceae bacterium]